MRYVMVLVLVLSGCSGVHMPDVDAATPAGDAALCNGFELYNSVAERMMCPSTAVCPQCPVLINSGRDCATLARALDACPDGGA